LDSLQRLICNVQRHLIDRQPAGVCRWVDAKPLAIDKFSKDKQAGFGLCRWPERWAMDTSYTLLRTLIRAL
jgi:hypothetical protein